jgi:thiamine biosynthesis lipoprotein
MNLREKTEVKYIDRCFNALGTINYIKIYNFENEEVIDTAVKRIFEIEQVMSAFKESSDIGRINKNAGNGFAAVCKDTIILLKRALEFSQMSSGAFDITVRPLVELWGIGKKKNFVPDSREINKTIKLVNYRDILIDSTQSCAALRRPGQAVDLGGIAKGYAADEVRRILLENNVSTALINLGGNIEVIGTRPDGLPWQVGVQNPLAPTGKYIGTIGLFDKTIVTSGSNERFFVKNGIRYHHIIDPRTGEPAQSSLLSVTVICDCSVDADALTTALFVLGIESGMDLVAKLQVQAIFVTEGLDVIVTTGLEDSFKLL